MDKTKALREVMKAKKIEALLIPRTDEFQGEYISPSSERLQWLTGFTGSAGFAIVTQDKAAFFTDGRYTLQAQEEIPATYELYNTMQLSPSQWAKEHIKTTDAVGFDPWLVTEKQLQAFGQNLIPLSTNPIDALWETRPTPPHDFIELHPLQFSGESSESKRMRVASSLPTDQVLLTACDSVAWLLNIRGHDIPYTPMVHSYCLLKKDGSFDLFVNLNKINGQIFNYLRENNGRAIEISQILSHLNKTEGSCLIDPSTAPYQIVKSLEEAPCTLIRGKDPCALPKAIKNKVELQGAQDAHIQDGLALCRFMAWLENEPLKGETTELSASKKLAEFRQEGTYFKDFSFETISGFGPHGAIIHYRVSEESDLPLTTPGIYLVDSGGQYLTGTTDVTRTLAFGSPTKDQKEKYTRVLKGHIALAKATFPEGTTGEQLDSLARQYLWEVGTDYAHGTGHGVGSYLNVHEGPQSISKRGSTVPLSAGMILSNEPGYYKEGAYGIRIESLVHVVESQKHKGYLSFETFTLAPFDLKLFDMSLLDSEEIKWIQSYHDRILEVLAPHLDQETKTWLQKTTVLQ